MKINSDANLLSSILNRQKNIGRSKTGFEGNSSDAERNASLDCENKLKFDSVLDERIRKIEQARQLVRSGEIDTAGLARSAAENILKYGI